MSATPVTDACWDADVLKAEGTVIVGVLAPSSGPCRVFQPVVDELASTLLGQARVLALDFAANPAAGRRYDVSSLPTLLVFRGGQLTGRLVGARSRERLLRELSSHLG